jgi:hypothetical protein
MVFGPRRRPATQEQCGWVALVDGADEHQSDGQAVGAAVTSDASTGRWRAPDRDPVCDPPSVDGLGSGPAGYDASTGVRVGVVDATQFPPRAGARAKVDTLKRVGGVY